MSRLFEERCEPAPSAALGGVIGFRVVASTTIARPAIAQTNRTAFTPDFGRVTSAKPPRQIQLGLRYEL
jgi:hypothetical protein